MTVSHFNDKIVEKDCIRKEFIQVPYPYYKIYNAIYTYYSLKVAPFLETTF